MTDSNLVRLGLVTETSFNVLPTSPVFQTMRVQSITLGVSNKTVVSSEIKSNRQAGDQILLGQSLAGGFTFEFSSSHFDFLLPAALLGSWTKILEKSGATQCGAVTLTTTFGVNANGATAVVGHLIRTSGYTTVGNNGLFRVASSTATTIVVAGTLSNEASTSASFLKIVGFRGASGDITATSTGLGSTSLDFTTLGLAVGMLVKIGGTTGAAAAESFATAANNDFARISAIAATALTLDNLPTGWATDTGTSKTITVYVSDYARVGSTVTSFSAETVHTDQASPTYFYDSGLMVNKLSISAKAQDRLTGSFEFLGVTAATPTVTQASGASNTAAPVGSIYNTSSNCSRISEGGSVLGTPNFVTDIQLNISNNLRELDSVGSLTAVAVGKGRCDVTGSMTTYFGSMTLYNKALALTNSTLIVVFKNSTTAYGFSLPRVQFSAPRPNASGINQDVTAVMSINGASDSTTSTNIQFDKFYEV